jgi:hypothetical protein
MLSGFPQAPKKLQALTQAQQERLAFLEVKAYFCGDLRRADIECRFGIKPAAATRDIATYRDLAPSNLLYDIGRRRYRPTSSFSPLFEFSTRRILSTLLAGFGDGLDLQLKKPIPCESVGALLALSLPILAIITRAINDGQIVEIEYLSLTSGASTKTIAPLALADNGARWHLRAFDRSKDRFADFVLTRIVSASASDHLCADHECLSADLEWNLIVDLELAPHPGVLQSAAIEADYGMKRGVLCIATRAALAGYALRRWQVDCSPEQLLDPQTHHLMLRNPAVLRGISSALLAPGFAVKADFVTRTIHEPL